MNLLERFLAEDWMIRPEVAPVLLRQVAGPEAAEEKEARVLLSRPTHDYKGNEFRKTEVINGIAVVPVDGPMLKGALPSDKRVGFISHEDIRADLEQAAAMPGVHGILMDVRSPGGSALGTPELAGYVAGLSARLPVFSFNDSVSASAAEFITAGASARFATPSSINGSIGSIVTLVDFSKMLENFGINVEVFASGKYKGLGHPAKPLTDDQRDWVRDYVQKSANNFKSFMLEFRPSLKLEHMEGQTFSGRQAADIGLIDGVVADRASLLAML